MAKANTYWAGTVTGWCILTTSTSRSHTECEDGGRLWPLAHRRWGSGQATPQMALDHYIKERWEQDHLSCLLWPLSPEVGSKILPGRDSLPMSETKNILCEDMTHIATAHVQKTMTAESRGSPEWMCWHRHSHVKNPSAQKKAESSWGLWVLIVHAENVYYAFLPQSSQPQIFIA